MSVIISPTIGIFPRIPVVNPIIPTKGPLTNGIILAIDLGETILRISLTKNLRRINISPNEYRLSNMPNET